MTINAILCLLFMFFLNTACKAPEQDPAFTDYDHSLAPYKFYEPTHIMPLHYDLEEISGLSYQDPKHLLAVQDERGILYILDPTSGIIQQEIKFGKSGDYEGVEVMDNEVYVVKSNGSLMHFKLEPGPTDDVDKINTKLSSKNDVEGLGLIGGELVLICKASGELDGNDAAGKVAYSFDTDRKKLNKKPFLSVRKKDIRNFLERKEHFKEFRDFDPSAIAEHPFNRDVYILSADRILVILSADFTIKEVVKLDRYIYKQPEGLCFMPDGTLYISTEGGGARGRLIELSYLEP